MIIHNGEYLAETKSGFIKGIPSDLSHKKGILTAYNCILSGNGWNDISGNALDAVLSGDHGSTFNGTRFFGTSAKAVIGNVGNVKTIAFQIKFYSDTQKILEGAAGSKFIYIDAGTLNYVDYDNAFVDGIDSDEVISGQWLTIIITSSTVVANSAVTMCLNGSDYGNYEIADLRFFDYEFSDLEIKNYNSLFNRISLKQSFKMDVVDGVVRTPDDMVGGTGSYKVIELAAQDPVLKELIPGTKLLENTVVGSIAMRSSVAFLELEFLIYKSLLLNQTRVEFIDNNDTARDVGGYRVELGENNEVMLVKTTLSTLFATAHDFIALDTYYKIKVVRLSTTGKFHDIGNDVDYDGDTFAVFIKGGSFGDTYTLVDVAGGSGTNPVKDSDYRISNFITIDSDVGDIIGNISVKSMYGSTIQFPNQGPTEIHNISVGEDNNTFAGTSPTWANFANDWDTTPAVILDVDGIDQGIKLKIPEATDSMNVRKQTVHTSISSGDPDFPDAILIKAFDSYGKFITDSKNGILRFSGMQAGVTYTFKVFCSVNLATIGWAESDADYTGLKLAGGGPDDISSLNPIDNLSNVITLTNTPDGSGEINLEFYGDEDWDHPLINAIIISR